jgi:hypothetical protein
MAPLRTRLYLDASTGESFGFGSSSRLFGPIAFGNLALGDLPVASGR